MHGQRYTLGQCGDKRRKSRDACIPKGSPWSLIHLFGRKLTSFVQQHFFRYKKIHQTLDRSRLRRFLMLGASHLDYKKFDAPLRGLLRMTKSADGRLPSIIAYRRRQKQQAVFVGFCSIPRGQPAGLVCSEVTKSAHSCIPCIIIYCRCKNFRKIHVPLLCFGVF